MKKITSIVFCIMLLSLGCKKKHTISSRAFYHWKSEFKLNDSVENYLNEAGIKKIYIRLFDVAWNEDLHQPVPVSVVKFSSHPRKEIVPVMYITNKTFLQIKKEDAVALAKNVWHKMQAIAEENKLQFSSIQFDCDWTETTAEKYFSFLQEMKKNSGGKNLEATIRLHQVKFYSKTGVPPVQRGVLMFYNMGKLNDFNTFNSIYDEATAKEYLVNFESYPLPLDVALPLFSWGVVFRNKVALKLINGIRRTDLEISTLCEKIEHNKYAVKHTGVLCGSRILKGEIIRLDEVSAQQCASAAGLLSPHIKNDSVSVILYHLSNHVIRQYPTAETEKIFNAFR